jgi:PIN domain nuclease of toxin-antitoxin system
MREQLEDPTTEVLVSAVSAFEISIKYHLGKLGEARALIEDWEGNIHRLSATALPLTPTHALRAGEYSSSHRDPFDRLLAAQAELENIGLVTRDAQFQGFPIQILW